jgi:DNA-binding transcriptional ArsR family regulator
MSATAKRNARSPRCISCGCTEDRACLVSVAGQLQGCAWILVDRLKGEGLCSACATLPQLLFALLEPDDPLGLTSSYGRTVSELAELTTTSPGRIRRALAQLEMKGLVERAYASMGGSEPTRWCRLEALT